MNRRGFLKLFGMAVAGVAIDQAIPLGRVWSFPSKIVVPSYTETMALALERVRASIPLMFEREHFIDRLWVHPEQHKAYMELSARNFRIPLDVTERVTE